MALNLASLRVQIQRVFDARLSDVAQIARRLADAYENYARAAQAPTGAPVTLKGFEKRVFATALESVLRSHSSAPQAAQAIGNAMTAFWLTPPVQFGTGLVTAILPQAAIGKMLSTKVDSASGAAEAFAGSLDLLTKTVFVTSPTPAPSGPIF